MADQPTGKREPTRATSAEESGVDGAGAVAARSALWDEVGIDPVEIALPRGTGFTLRAYRAEREITPTAIPAGEPDHLTTGAGGADTDLDEAAGFDAGDTGGRRVTHTRSGGRDRSGADRDDDEADGVSGVDDEDLPDAEFEEDGSAEDAGDEEQDEDPAAGAEEVPVFLGAKGRLYLFQTAEGLVDFVRSGTPNDLTQLGTWPELVTRIQVSDVVPDEDDVYELDLVVDNLRAGHDAWDGPLLIKAGEVARDLGYAYQLASVTEALTPGSPLDELDEALRSVESGGVGGFFARRRVRRIKEQQAALGWRTVIGKISGLVDWRE